MQVAPVAATGRPPLQAWVVLGAVALALVVTAGIRSAFGLFLIPLTYEFDWSRTNFSGVIAVSTLVFGFTQPIMGRMVDRSGPRAALLWALAFFVAGLALAPLTTTLGYFYFTFGVLVGLGTGASSLAPNAALISQWFSTNRGLAIGILSGAMSAGQVVMAPVISWLLAAYGWRFAFLGLGGIVLLLVLPVLFLFRSPQAVRATAKAVPSWEQIWSFVCTPTFVLLAFGFVICGFSEAFVATHLPASAHDHGQSNATAVGVLTLIGLAGVLGAVVLGWLSDRWGRRIPLALVYFVRALGLPALAFLDRPALLLAGSLIVGLTWKTNASLVTTMLGDEFGPRAVGTLFGLQFLLHQIGMSAGSYLGGLVFDLVDTYEPIIFLSAGLLVLSGVAALAVKEEPAGRAPGCCS